MLYSFLEKSDTPRETLVLEYSFGRKSSQKQSIDKIICHVWEYGGRLEMLKSVLTSIPISKKFYYCVMVDLSKIKTIWDTLETSLQAVKENYTDTSNFPEIIIIGGKYDIFKNYGKLFLAMVLFVLNMNNKCMDLITDSEIKKFICTTIRSVALIFNTYLLFYSYKESHLLRKAKEMFYTIGFGTGVPLKEKNTNYAKPLIIPKGSDSWDSIGVSASTLEQVSFELIRAWL